MNLFIDTTNSNFCLYLFDNDYKLLFKKNTNGERRYSEMLPKVYYECLKSSNLKVSEIKKLYLAIGPGSYTGMRISLAFAKSLKLLNDKITILTIKSPQVYIDYQFDGVHQIDARGGFYYTSKFINGEFKGIRLSELLENSNSNLLINFPNLVNHIKENHFEIQEDFFKFKLDYHKKLNYRKLK